LHLIETFRGSCPAPILSPERNGEKQVLCDFLASPDNRENLLQVVDEIWQDEKPLTTKISINIDKTALNLAFCLTAGEQMVK
jgi:hypothetical protein